MTTTTRHQPMRTYMLVAIATMLSGWLAVLLADCLCRIVFNMGILP